MDKFTIDLKLPSLNEYIDVCRGNKYQAANFKKSLENDIQWFIKRMPKYVVPIKIHFHWIEGSKRRDLDNVAFAKKFILDAMVKAGKLKDDNRKCVTAFTDTFEYGKKTMVVISIEPELYDQVSEYKAEEERHKQAVRDIMRKYDSNC